jgi:hypothetical protein
MKKLLHYPLQVLGNFVLMVVSACFLAACKPAPTVSTKHTPSESVAQLMSDYQRDTLSESQMWQKVSDLSEAEIKEAISLIEKTDTYEDFPSEFPTMILYRWGKLDPPVALKKAKAMYPKQFLREPQAVITAWINQGAEREVWDAIKEESEMWDCTRSVAGEVAEMLVASWSGLSDQDAFNKVMHLDDTNCHIADILCQYRARKAWKTAESRASFLAAAGNHPNPYVIDCAYEKLIREWAKINPDDAVQEIARFPLPEKEKESLRFWAKLGSSSPSKSQTLISSEGEPWNELNQRLTALWESSPCVLVDYELREKSRKMLEELPANDLAEWAALPIPKEIIDYDKNIPERLRDFIIESLPAHSYAKLIGMLALQNRDDSISLYRIDDVVTLWTMRDPASLLNWLEGSLPASVNENLNEYREEALLEFAKIDPEAFAIQIKKVDPEVRENVLEEIELK